MKKLTLIILFIPLVLFAQKAVQVDATKLWTDTGIDVNSGEILAVNSYGIYLEASDAANPRAWRGPEGSVRIEDGAQYPLPGVAGRCLIGKIGDGGAPFAVGSRYIKEVTETGRLFLGINDINFSNNSGYLMSVICTASYELKEVKVMATEPWTDTGLDVAAGDVVWAFGYGVYRDSEKQGIEYWIGPGGYLGKSKPEYPIADARARGVIGKVGNGSPFIVGDKERLNITENGRLFLGINDINFANNEGYAAFLIVRYQSSGLALNNADLAPDGFALFGNYPNPFNPATKIVFSQKERGKTSLKIYNLNGQMVRTLVDSELLEGNHEIEWDGLDDFSQSVPSGLYLYKLSVNGKNLSGKATLVK